MSFRICTGSDKHIARTPINHNQVDKETSMNQTLKSYEETVTIWDRTTMSWQEKKIVRSTEQDEDERLRAELRGELFKDGDADGGDGGK